MDFIDYKEGQMVENHTNSRVKPYLARILWEPYSIAKIITINLHLITGYNSNVD